MAEGARARGRALALWLDNSDPESLLCHFPGGDTGQGMSLSLRSGMRAEALPGTVGKGSPKRPAFLTKHGICCHIKASPAKPVTSFQTGPCNASKCHGKNTVPLTTLSKGHFHSRQLKHGISADYNKTAFKKEGERHLNIDLILDIIGFLLISLVMTVYGDIGLCSYP